jgi:hypothetical protein
MPDSIERQKVKQRLLLDNFFTCAKEYFPKESYSLYKELKEEKRQMLGQ